MVAPGVGVVPGAAVEVGDGVELDVEREVGVAVGTTATGFA